MPLLADVKAKAVKAAKAVKKGSFKASRKPRYSVLFHRPKTLQRTRDPKYARVRCVIKEVRPSKQNIREPPPCAVPRAGWTGAFD